MPKALTAAHAKIAVGRIMADDPARTIHDVAEILSVSTERLDETLAEVGASFSGIAAKFRELDGQKWKDTYIKVRGIIRSAPRVRYLDPGEVAAQAGVSATTINRHLSAIGVNYQTLVIARKFCKMHEFWQANPGATVCELMAKSEYTCSHSFYFAFGNWHGVTFRDYRAGIL